MRGGEVGGPCVGAPVLGGRVTAGPRGFRVVHPTKEHADGGSEANGGTPDGKDTSARCHHATASRFAN